MPCRVVSWIRIDLNFNLAIGLMSVSEIWNLFRIHPGFGKVSNGFKVGKEFWRTVNHHSGHILASLPYSDPNSRPGKLIWLAKNIDLTDTNRIYLVSLCQRSAKQSRVSVWSRGAAVKLLFVPGLDTEAGSKDWCGCT